MQTPPAAPEAPPPGWGTVESTSYGAITQYKGASVGAVRKRRRSPLEGAAPYLKLAVALAILGLVVYIAFSTFFSQTNLKVNIVNVSDEPISGTLKVRDRSGALLGEARIEDRGARCPGGRQSEVRIKTKKASEYVFETPEGETPPLTSSEIAAAKGEVTVEILPGAMRARAGPSGAC